MKKSSRVTVTEICTDLQLGRQRVYKLLELKVIPNVRTGRTWLVTRNAYQAWKSTCGTERRLIAS
jgi:excisionase family DNA binding protein